MILDTSVLSKPIKGSPITSACGVFVFACGAMNTLLGVKTLALGPLALNFPELTNPVIWALVTGLLFASDHKSDGGDAAASGSKSEAGDTAGPDTGA